MNSSIRSSGSTRTERCCRPESAASVRRCGSILLDKSIASINCVPGRTVYGAGKAALYSSVRTGQVKLKDRKIRETYSVQINRHFGPASCASELP